MRVIDEIILKDEIKFAKISQTKITIYFQRNEPVFFEAENNIYPTLYTLWMIPDLIDSFTTYSPVSTFILNGADLMLPGVILSEDFSTKNISVGDICSVKVSNNRYPFAVGRSLMNINQMMQKGLKGKSVEILHSFGDALWQTGSKCSPSKNFTLKIIYETDSDPEKSDCHQNLHTNRISMITENSNQLNLKKIQFDSEKYKIRSTKQKPRIKRDAFTLGEDDENTDDNEIIDDWEAEIDQCENEEISTQIICGCKITNIESESNDAISESNAHGIEKLDFSDTKSTVISPEEMNWIMDYCLYEVLNKLTDDQLPLEISALYGRMVSEGYHVIMYQSQLHEKLKDECNTDIDKLIKAVQNMDKNGIVDVKRSTYKKLSKYIQCKDREKLMETKINRGIHNVIKVNKGSPKLKNYNNLEKPKTLGDGAVNDSSGINKPEMHSKSLFSVEEVYQVRQNLSPIFDAIGVKCGRQSYFTRTECDEVLSMYLKDVLTRVVDQTGLDKNTIRLDQVLCDALLRKNGDVQTLELKELRTLFHSSLQMHYAIRKHGSPVEPIKYIIGNCPKVKIIVENRSGRKHITHIEGLSVFFDDVTELTELLQKKLACSSSTYEIPGRSDNIGVSVQGKVAQQVAEILSKKFAIPDKYIEVIQKKKN